MADLKVEVHLYRGGRQDESHTVQLKRPTSYIKPVMISAFAQAMLETTRREPFDHVELILHDGGEVYEARIRVPLGTSPSGDPGQHPFHIEVHHRD